MNRDQRNARVSRVGVALLVSVTCAFFAVFARVVQLQISPPQRLVRFVDDRMLEREDFAPRGDIVDRRGRLIAATRPGLRVFVDPARFPEPYDAAVVKLAEAMGVDPDEVGARVIPRLVENERRRAQGRAPIRYVSIGGVLEGSRAEEVRAMRMPGVHLERRSVRETPGGELVAGVAGKVGVDHDGLLGAEWAFDDRMRPRHGMLRYVHDARGRALWIEAGGYTPPIRGEAIRLSVDLAVQRIAEEEVARALGEFDAAGGRAIVIDPTTGEMLAMVDMIRDVPGLVDFDASRRGEMFEVARRFRTIPRDERRAVHPAMGRNRNVEDAYEPGSTFKAFMWAGATELGMARLDDEIDTEGGRWRTPYGRAIEDVVRRGKMSWRDVLVNSSNIGMIKVTDRMTDRQMQETIRKFGFGQRTQIGLPGESAGIVTPARNWNKYTRTSVAFGYEVAVTPVQMARAFAAFARADELAGTLPRLRLTAVGPGQLAAEPVFRVLPAWTAHFTRQSLRGVVDNMDRRLLQEGVLETKPSYSMFGKSGTARVALPTGRGYFPNQYVSSFIAGAPADDPRIVVLVVIDDPGQQMVSRRMHYGSWNAGPVTRRIVERVLPYMGVAPDAPDAVAAAQQ